MLTALLAALVAANSAAVPEPRNAVWLRRHEELVAEARWGGIEVLFLGDSLTEGWLEEGRAAWERDLAPLRAANFGISGDRVQNLLWRSWPARKEQLASYLSVPLLFQAGQGFNGLI